MHDPKYKGRMAGTPVGHFPEAVERLGYVDLGQAGAVRPCPRNVPRKHDQQARYRPRGVQSTATIRQRGDPGNVEASRTPICGRDK